MPDTEAQPTEHMADQDTIGADRIVELNVPKSGGER